MTRLSDIGKMAADDPIRAKAQAVRDKKAGKGGPDDAPKAKNPKAKPKAATKTAAKAAPKSKAPSALQKFMENADKGRNIRERGALPKGSGKSAAQRYLRNQAGPLRQARTSSKTAASLATRVGKAIYNFSPIKPIGDYVSGRPAYLKSIAEAGFAGRQGARLGRMLSLGGTAVRVGGRSLLPLNLAMTAYDVAKATKEGAGALRAARGLKKTKAHTEANYGTVAQATATRKSKRKNETSAESRLRRSR